MRKVYEKPYLEVVEYVGDYGYASSATSTCWYLTCLVGSQSSEGISGLTIYKFTYNNTTYYMWYHVYGENESLGDSDYDIENVTLTGTFSSNKSGTSWYEDLMTYVCGLIGKTYEGNGRWHIATDADGYFNES